MQSREFTQTVCIAYGWHEWTLVLWSISRLRQEIGAYSIMMQIKIDNQHQHQQQHQQQHQLSYSQLRYSFPIERFEIM